MSISYSLFSRKTAPSCQRSKQMLMGTVRYWLQRNSTTAEYGLFVWLRYRKEWSCGVEASRVKFWCWAILTRNNFLLWENTGLHKPSLICPMHDFWTPTGKSSRSIWKLIPVCTVWEYQQINQKESPAYFKWKTLPLRAFLRICVLLMRKQWKRRPLH